MSKRYKHGSGEPEEHETAKPQLSRLRAATRRKAAGIAARYRVVIESIDAGYRGSCIELPLVLVRASTIEACVQRTRTAATIAVATMLEVEQQPPLPPGEERRGAQVNIRLTADERMRIEETARQEGFRSVSDYIRHAALRGPR